jgi:hypothetical protein
VTKRYLCIKWIHADPHEPVEFYYELGNGQWALRGIQLFADGSSSSVTYGVKEAQAPSLEEINLDPQLQGSEITEKEFEAIWFELMSC